MSYRFLSPFKTPPKTVSLSTPFEEEMPKIPFNEHPRPQMKRDDFLSLNGSWKLGVVSANETTEPLNITVPFPPESRISGIEKSFKNGDILIYNKTFTLPDGFKGKRIFFSIVIL